MLVYAEVTESQKELIISEENGSVKDPDILKSIRGCPMDFPNIIAAIDSLDMLPTDSTWFNLETKDRPFDYVPYEDCPEVIEPYYYYDDPYRITYPDSLVKAGIEGMVYLEVFIFRDGTIRKIRLFRYLMKGSYRLGLTAVNEVKKWKFKPGKCFGKAIDTSVIISVEFSLTK